MKTTWTTAPISPTCERITDYSTPTTTSKHEQRKYTMCECATSYAYPAMGTGWMALCWNCVQKHLPHVTYINELIAAGEKWEGL